MRLKKIDLVEMNLRDKRFCISFGDNVEKLKLSIKSIGVTSPPIITPGKGKKSEYILVSGFKRVLACKQVGLKNIPCFVTRSFSDLENFKIAVMDNIGTRELNPIEKSNVVFKLLKFNAEKKEVISKYLPLLSLEPNVNVLNNFLTLQSFSKRIKNVLKPVDNIRNVDLEKV